MLRGVYSGFDEQITNILAEAKSKDLNIACQGVGCSACCYDVSVVSIVEVQGMKRAFRGLSKPKRRQILRQLTAWWDLHEVNDALVSVPQAEDIEDLEPAEVALLFDENEVQAKKALVLSWKEKTPCMFLLDNACSIYADRPLCCRGHYAVEADPGPCTEKNEGTKAIQILNLNGLMLQAWTIFESIGGSDEKRELHHAMRAALRSSEAE
jgi:Fe-S-cluster containining protein